MRISGIEVSARKPIAVSIPRGQVIHTIWCHPVESYAEFEAMVPRPVTKTRVFPDGRKEQSDTPAYQSALQDYANKRTCWLVIHSLKDIEWDTVKKDDPETWINYDTELSSVFSIVEINKIMEAVFIACGLSGAAIEAATKDFLASLEAQQVS